MAVATPKLYHKFPFSTTTTKPIEMKLSFFKAAHVLLVVMTIHLASVVAPDPSQYIKNSDITNKIVNIQGSQTVLGKWDIAKRFGEGFGAGIGYSNYTGDSAGTGWDGQLIKYDYTKPVTVEFANKGGNTDNGFWCNLQRLGKYGKQFILHLGREATDAERLEAYVVEIAGYIEEIANAKDGVVFPFVSRHQLIESLRKNITQLPNRNNAETDKDGTVNSETAALMAALLKINAAFSEKSAEFEKLLKKKIEGSVDREITSNIIEAKFLAVLEHFQQKGLMVIRQHGDSTTVTAKDPDVAPILLFTGGITIADDKSGAGRKGSTIMLRAVRELEIMHFLVDNKYATSVRAMDIQSYKSNTVNPDTLPHLEQFEKDLLRPQMRLPVTPNLTIVIGQFTEEHVEAEGQEFIQIIIEDVWNTITDYVVQNPTKVLKETSVKNYTAYRVGINPGDMPTFHKYESDYAELIKLIQGKVEPCPYYAIKGVCKGGVLTWEDKPLTL